MRHALILAARQLVVETQFGGGMNCGDTGIAHVYLRCLVDFARGQKLSLGILFLDIVAAFATLLRRIAYDIEGGDEKWLHALACAGFSEQEVGDIYKEVCASLWQAVECNTISVALASCLY